MSCVYDKNSDLFFIYTHTYAIESVTTYSECINIWFSGRPNKVQMTLSSTLVTSVKIMTELLRVSNDHLYAD